MYHHFYNTFLNLFNIYSRFSGGTMISSTGFCFSIFSSFDLVCLVKFLNSTASVILFPKILLVLCSTFLEASSPVSNNCFLYFHANGLFLVLYNNVTFIFINKQYQINFIFYF